MTRRDRASARVASRKNASRPMIPRYPGIACRINYGRFCQCWRKKRAGGISPRREVMAQLLSCLVRHEVASLEIVQPFRRRRIRTVPSGHREELLEGKGYEPVPRLFPQEVGIASRSLAEVSIPGGVQEHGREPGDSLPLQHGFPEQLVAPELHEPAVGQLTYGALTVQGRRAVHPVIQRRLICHALFF